MNKYYEKKKNEGYYSRRKQDIKDYYREYYQFNKACYTRKKDVISTIVEHKKVMLSFD